MSIAFDLFCLMASVRMQTAHLLSNYIGVGPCGCPSLIAALLIGIASLALLKLESVSDSCADDITASMTLLVTRTGVFVGGGCLLVWCDSQLWLIAKEIIFPTAGASFGLIKVGCISVYTQVHLATYASGCALLRSPGSDGCAFGGFHWSLWFALWQWSRLVGSRCCPMPVRNLC